MHIFFDQTTLHQSSKMGAVTGVVYFDFDEIQFPAAGWNDFVVVVASWWLAALDRLVRDVATETKLCFMDGPYWITAALNQEENALMRCIENRNDAGVVWEELIDFCLLDQQVRELARAVLFACEDVHIETADLDTLRHYLL